MSAPMHIWRLGDNSWWFAETGDQATEMFCKETGCTVEDSRGDNDDDPYQWPDDKPLTLREEDGSAETKMPSEWIAEMRARDPDRVPGSFFCGEP